MRAMLCRLFALVLLGASAPTPLRELDSQLVIERYAAALAQIELPKNVVFTYSVSQAGLHNIEQTHRIFRGPAHERDEVLAIDGDPVKFIRILKSTDRYAITKLAPRSGAYAFLFLGTHRNGKHLDYVYSTTPLGTSIFTVSEITIDGSTYLPNVIRFSTKTGTVKAIGSIVYAKSSRYWMPQAAAVSATVSGHPTRERIVWSAYSFPPALPPSTFNQPKPTVLPTFAPF